MIGVLLSGKTVRHDSFFIWGQDMSVSQVARQDLFFIRGQGAIGFLLSGKTRFIFHLGARPNWFLIGAAEPCMMAVLNVLDVIVRWRSQRAVFLKCAL